MTSGNDDEIAAACVVLLIAWVLQASRQPRKRKQCLKRKRLDWECRAELLEQSRQFERCYKMSRAAFDALLLLLAPALGVDEQQSRNRTGIDSISPVNKLQMFLRYMSAGSHHDIMAYSGVSDTAFFDSVEEVIDAILQHPALQIKFPTDEAAQERVVRGLTSLSNGGVINGCVGAIDGFLCKIAVPRKDEVSRVRAFFSGHYRCYGVNVQACCDHLCRFTSVSIASPGGTGDAVAYKEWGLAAIVAALKIGRYIIGDNAYANGNRLLTPFSRPSIKSDYHDSFNFHLSQLRIRIEMAFGLLVRKWRIFRSPLQVKFDNVPRIIMVACMLHNWCINQRLVENPNYDPAMDETLAEGIRQLPAVQSDESPYRQLYASPEGVARREQVAERETNLIRNALVQKLERRTQKRPRRNQARRIQEAHH